MDLVEAVELVEVEVEVDGACAMVERAQEPASSVFFMSLFVIISRCFCLAALAARSASSLASSS